MILYFIYLFNLFIYLIYLLITIQLEIIFNYLRDV